VAAQRQIKSGGARYRAGVLFGRRRPREFFHTAAFAYGDRVAAGP
jgi:hypothetical protein